ncbi:FHA domain-containing protein [Spirulina subsalsa FACHB-351]|uniref:FHA domain-containing protein n=1 Tax=Spirulina subsalsa FACHB-351 TaxID=234711 RepID=A0ABT3KZI0_9CYAN|nr:FHA domain-containing protein [Spirulina subsalsa]MCW6034671.1 FHA domain-containing protein [Spirulina subsalsa FACHB-351]
MAAKTAKLHQEHLLIIEDDKGRRSVPLIEASYSIGRDQSCDIRLSSQFVSRRHAILNRRLQADGTSFYEIVDGDENGKRSVNGLLINGVKLQDQTNHSLQHGDEVVFGPQVFAIYQVRQRGVMPSASNDDPFDITLIDPAMMMGDFDESSPDE